MEIILIRYGEYKDGHLDEEGKKAMFLVAKKIAILVENKKCCIICAKVPRAIESGEIIGKSLGTMFIKSFAEFYAAENVPVNIDKARKVLDSLKKEFDVVVAVVSREYIEELGKKPLDRGEFLVLEYK